MAPSPKNKPKSADAAVLRLARGARLGKYRLQKQLGKGGYSEVWKARDTVEGIQVALKIPLVGTSGLRDNESLLREVRLVAQLRHPHIMPIKNADIIAGHAVIATQLSGGTLDDCSRPMSPRRIVSIAAQVLDGLAYAHRNRVAHCDVSPGNIFLFADHRAALGDFGIGLELKGRMRTVDEYGTPGYVAPEQAYGRPTYRSDCFSVGLILYEYLTGHLPRWPFRWPPRSHERLKERTSTAFVAFIRKALAVDPANRFANAEQMLAAMLAAMPRHLRAGLNGDYTRKTEKELDWRQIRRESFAKRYRKVFPVTFRCVECGEPVAESMQVCPWCATAKNRFDANSQFDHLCPRCHKGVLPEWKYCPWCFGPGFKSPASRKTPGARYHSQCRHCKGRLMRFMKYCPWCRRKVDQPWDVAPFPEFCGQCGWSVDSEFWSTCPWCEHDLRA